VHIVTINKRRFAVGLWWQVLDGQARISRKERLAQAKAKAGEFGEAGYDMVVFRERQYGLGTSVGKLGRIPSLACALVERSPESWIGLFRLDENLWWVCAVGKRIIAGDGDQVFQSLDEARAHYDNLKSLTTWESDTCLEDVEQSLEHILGLIKQRERIEPLYPKSYKKPVLVLVLAMILSGVGLHHYLEYKGEQARQRAREALLESQEKAAANKEAIQNQPERYFSKIWLDSPLPSAFGKKAFEQILTTPVFDAGWRLDSVAIDPTDAVQTWRHEAQASFACLPTNASLDKNPTQATARFPLPAVNATRKERSLFRRQDATSCLYQLTQILGARLSVSWADSEEKEIEDRLLSAPVRVRCPWISGSYSISSIPDSPSVQDMFHTLDRIPGLVVGNITWKNNQFTVEGTVYVMP
jgi:hypothetical protein